MKESIFITLVNALAYTFVIPYWYKKHGISIGIFIWLLFVFSSWFTFFFIQQPLYISSIHYGRHTVIPYIYLFVVLYIFISPLCKLRPLKKKELVFEESKFGDYYMFLMIIIQLASIIIDVPGAIKTFSSSLYNIAATRDQAYEGVTSALSWSIPGLAQLKGWIQSPLNVVNNGLVFVFILFCKKNRFLVWLFSFVTIFQTLMNSVISVSRGELFFIFVFWFLIVLFLYNQISKKVLAYMNIILVFLLMTFVPFVITISTARFGSSSGFFLFKYFGEAMNNFNVLLWDNINGNTWGNAYFGFLSGHRFENTIEKWEYIERTTKVSGQYFYTFVGGFVLEFGKILPVLIAIMFNRIISKLIIRRRNMNMGVFVLSIIFFDFYLKGAFIFSWQGQFVLELLYVSIAYLYFNRHSKKQRFRTAILVKRNKMKRL